MNKRVKRWRFLLPLIIGMVIMSVAFVLISYVTFRDVEIEDYLPDQMLCDSMVGGLEDTADDLIY